MFDFKNMGFVLRYEKQKPVFYYSEIPNEKRTKHYKRLHEFQPQKVQILKNYQLKPQHISFEPSFSIVLKNNFRFYF